MKIIHICLINIITKKDKAKKVSLWNDKEVMDEMVNNNITDVKNTQEKKDEKNTKERKDLDNVDDTKNNIITMENSHNDNNRICNSEEKGEIRTYIYFGVQQINKFYENDYFYNNNFLLTSKNKFNNIFDYDKES